MRFIFFSRSDWSQNQHHSENKKFLICNIQIHLPATSLHSFRSEIDIFIAWYQFSNPLIAAICAFSQFTTLICSIVYAKLLSSYPSFHVRNEMKIRESQSPGCMVDDQTLPIENADGSCLLWLSLSRSRTMPHDNNMRTIS